MNAARPKDSTSLTAYRDPAAGARMLVDEFENLEKMLNKPPGTRRTALRVLGLLLLVIVIECAIVALMMPDPGKTAEMARRISTHPFESPAHAESVPPLLAEPDKPREVELGRFQTSVVYPPAEAVYQVELNLVVLVEAKDVERFEGLLASHRFRFRQAVLLALRTADAAELSEPGLGLLKRRILTKTNRVLGAPLVHEIVVSDYSLHKR